MFGVILGKITYKITNSQIFWSNMIELSLPPYLYKLKQLADKSIAIWDNTRRRYVALTPEEWVRQHFVAFLINHRNTPAGRIGNEISLTLNNRARRCDTIVYDEQGNPLILIEYKAPHVSITQSVFDQIVRYNMVYRVPYIMVSNGISHYCCHIDYGSHQCVFLENIPFYQDMV